MIILRLAFIANFVATIGILFTWWHYLNGFNWLEPAWWHWLIDNLKLNGQLPAGYIFATKFVIIASFVTLILITIFGNRSRTRTIFGQRGSKDLHGSAKWARHKDIKKAGLFSGKGVVIGGYKGWLSNKTLYDNSGEHVLCFAPTGSGKGVGLVIPTLLNWTESGICSDIKGENFARTSGYLVSQGIRVLKFEPTCETGSCKFNPLAEIRAGTMNVIEDCQNIALMIIDPEGKGVAKDHWKQNGYHWLAVVLLHVMYQIRLSEGRCANLSDVHQFMSAVGDVSETENIEVAENFIVLLNSMSGFDHQDELVHAEVVRGANAMRIKAFPEQSGIHSSAAGPLALYSDPIISRNIASSDFIISDFQYGEKPLMLFLTIPASDIIRLKPLLRMIMQLTLNRLTNELVREANSKPSSLSDRVKSQGGSVRKWIIEKSALKRPVVDKLVVDKLAVNKPGLNELGLKNAAAKRSGKYKLLLMLDEFTNLGKLDILNSGITYLRGFGIRLYIWIQNIQQLEETYGKNNNIMPNCNVRISYTPNDAQTAELLVKLVGKETIVQKKTSISSKSNSIAGSKSESISETSRPLMTADEFLTMPSLAKDTNDHVTGPGDMVILLSGKRPIYGEQILYFKNQKLAERTYLAPVQSLSGHSSKNPSLGSQSPETQAASAAREETQASQKPEFTPYSDIYTGKKNHE